MKDGVKDIKGLSQVSEDLPYNTYFLWVSPAQQISDGLRFDSRP